jgi:hypothetical protein
MDLCLENWNVAQVNVPDPQTGRGKDGGNGVGADQEPEQMMVDELRQSEERESAVIHIYLFLELAKGYVKGF